MLATNVSFFPKRFSSKGAATSLFQNSITNFSIKKNISIGIFLSQLKSLNNPEGVELE